MKKVITLLSTVVFVACGVEEEEDVVIHVPPAKPPVVQVSVPAPVVVSASTPAPTPAPKKTVCHVLLTDNRGNVSRLSYDDLFFRNSELAKEFEEPEADLLIKNKKCRVSGDLSKYCWTK